MPMVEMNNARSLGWMPKMDLAWPFQGIQPRALRRLIFADSLKFLIFTNMV